MPNGEGSTSDSDDLSNMSCKRCRVNPPARQCPGELFLAAPVLRTIPIESVFSSTVACPLLMVVKPWQESSQLINFFTSEQLVLKHRVILPLCRNSFNTFTGEQQPHYSFYFRCFYSTKSWMLLWEKYPLCCYNNKSLLIVLLNPLTNQMIELPDIGNYEIHDAAFSLSLDMYASPDCVIAIASRSKYFCDIGIYVTKWRPGWTTWQMHSTSENRVCCFTESGKMYIFYLNGHKGFWGISRYVNDPDLVLDGVESQDIEIFYGKKILNTAGRSGSYNFVLGKDGKEILHIKSWNNEAGKRVYRFYMLDPKMMNWIRFDNDEWMGQSWFFTDEYVLSTSVIGGRKTFRKSNTELYRIKDHLR